MREMYITIQSAKLLLQNGKMFNADLMQGALKTYCHLYIFFKWHKICDEYADIIKYKYSIMIYKAIKNGIVHVKK